jgi:hypothetical protein
MHKLMMAAVFGTLPVAGQACTYLEPFDMANLPGAELVVVGTVTAYQELGTAWRAALVTVEVEEALKGRALGDITFIWNGGMAQGPHESRANGRVLIGAARGGRIAVSDMAPDARPDLPSIVQPYCGEVWMLPATDATVAKAKEVLE